MSLPKNRREALEKWKSRLGKEATYRALIEVFYEAGEITLADLVCDLFKIDEAGSKLVTLVDLYIRRKNADNVVMSLYSLSHSLLFQMV